MTFEPEREVSAGSVGRAALVGDVTIGGRTLLLVLGLVGGTAMLVLPVGFAITLFSLHGVKAELASLRQAVMRGQAGRPPSPPPVPIPAEPVSLAGAQTRGSSAARVAILEFSDFQCPFCSRFTQTTYMQLVSEFIDTGKVLLAFRHLPLVQIHPQARKAAEAAECGGRQGKFWEMHDRLFADPARLSMSDLRVHATSAGLRLVGFDVCVAGEAAERITLDIAEAERLQVYGTPGFLLGTIQPDGRLTVSDRLSGAQPIGAFREVLERLLASTY